ncbi:ATPase AAA-type core [Penicillium coprophilum]|uniref:ATPase AAA-type core n=1 Tax=Penicillium coprophilum TaxID=36646 RepID=UPI0023971FF5|nr:ATPase AAA-type core [Penicillium coprophilum]KAJ5159050.1 ATPase AAA-type core [Penicillium coprophilum]
MLNDIEYFLSPRAKLWYETRGILYRRGYLLYGPPGTGKSISLNSQNLDEDSLVGLFQKLPKRCIMLLEDMDRAGIDQEGDKRRGNSENSSQVGDSKTLHRTGISLLALLNCLDGVAAQEGRILIMTTNHLEKLDAALIRPGRVDKRYHFGFVNTESIKELFHLFFDKSPIEKGSVNDETWEKSKSELCDEFVNIVVASDLTAVQINNYLMDYKENPELAVLNARDWMGRIREIGIVTK